MPTGPDSPDNNKRWLHEDAACYFCYGSGQLPINIQGVDDHIVCDTCRGNGKLAVWRII